MGSKRHVVDSDLQITDKSIEKLMAIRDVKGSLETLSDSTVNISDDDPTAVGLIRFSLKVIIAFMKKDHKVLTTKYCDS